MKIVIIGDGKVGYTLTQALSREGHDLMVIDNRKDVLEQAEERLDVMVLEGNGASVNVQMQAGVQSSDLMIAVTSADEVNLLCCMIARKLGCRHTIARIRNPEYTQANYLLRNELGLSMVVNPERTAAREIFGLLQYPSFLRRDLFAKGRAEIAELPVRQGSRLDGIKLHDLYSMLRVRVLVCAVERNNEVFIPDGAFTLKNGDYIYVTAPAKYLLSLVKFMGFETAKIKSAMIIGGSRIAFYLSKMLLDAGIKVKVIELNAQRCAELSETLENATIVHADGTSFETLQAEGINETDAMIALMNFDEQNLVVSMYANNMNVPKVITKINRVEYGQILRTAGMECVISPRMLICNDILRYVRAMQNRQGEGVIALHRMVDNRVEALEFLAGKDTWYLGTPLKNIPLKPNLLLAVISHNESVVIPGGDDCFVEGDTLVIVTNADRSMGGINDIFSRAPHEN